MGCDDVRDLLALYVGGECYDNERIAVEAHVPLCSGCARELDQYREARAALAELADEDVPEKTLKGLSTAVRDEVFRRGRRRVLPFELALRCAAAVMVGLAIGAVAYTVRGGPPAPAPGAAIPEPRAVARPALRSVELPPPSGEPRYHGPRARSEGNFYLPRVEALPVGGEKDF